jgi:heptosyltransferase-2
VTVPATLIVGPSWVGDMVMAQALFILLQQRRPEAAIDVLAPAWSLPVVARMPQVRRGIAGETGHGELGLGKRRRIGYSLRGEGYERAIVLPRSLKSALIPWFARIPRRTGFRGESRYGLINDMRPFDKSVLDQTVKRFVALGLDPGDALPTIPFPALSVDRQKQDKVMESLGIATEKPVIAMMPGAEYGPAKCWPPDYFAELSTQLGNEGYAVWVLGSDKDAPAGERIAAASAARNLCGRTSLEDVIDLLGYAEQAISNDSGLMHIAAAVGTHVHGIYGSSSPEFTPPLTDERDIHWLHLDCSPCFERSCPLGHLRCLKELSVAMLHEAIQDAHRRLSGD